MLRAKIRTILWECSVQDPNTGLTTKASLVAPNYLHATPSLQDIHLLNTHTLNPETLQLFDPQTPKP